MDELTVTTNYQGQRRKRMQTSFARKCRTSALRTSAHELIEFTIAIGGVVVFTPTLQAGMPGKIRSRSNWEREGI